MEALRKGRMALPAIGGQHLRDLMHDALGQGQGALTAGERPQQLADGSEGSPHPLWGAWEAPGGRCFRDRASLESAEQGLEVVQLHLGAPPVMEAVLGTALELLRCCHQPLRYGGGGDRKAPGQGAEGPEQQRRAEARAMQERAIGVEDSAAANGAGQRAPGSRAGMAVGTDRAESSPALLGTAPLRAKVRRGGNDAAPASGRDDLWRRRRG